MDLVPAPLADIDPASGSAALTPAVSTFRPAWWLPHAHLQTLWAAIVRRAPRLTLLPERLELPDGDFVDLLWTRSPCRGPLLVVLHGLEGSIRSNYVAGMLAAGASRGWCAVLMHFRGCSGVHNRLDRSYHSGDTGDIGWLLEQLALRAPGARMAAVGYSLGGNVLLKYLGERGRSAPLAAAAAVSVPFELADSAARLTRGLSRLYQQVLLDSLKQKLRDKFRRRPAPVDLTALARCGDFPAFDAHVTAPLHGYAGVHDYYRSASCRQYLHAIEVPTLIVHAVDDPFMTPACIPHDSELGPGVRLELCGAGGHVGFVTGSVPWRAGYWLEARIPEFLAPYLES